MPTREQIIAEVPSVKRAPLKELARIVEAEVSSPRAIAALATMYYRANNPPVINYRQYLKTEKWKFTRDRKLTEPGHQCALCPSRTRLQVHHRTYERVGKERMEDLIVLCRRCHSRHHGYDQ